MKKIYKNPSMEVVTIHTQQMLAASLPTSDKDASEWGARGFDFDFDEDDED